MAELPSICRHTYQASATDQKFAVDRRETQAGQGNEGAHSREGPMGSGITECSMLRPRLARQLVNDAMTPGIQVG
jgi:hypothetical protein